MKQEILRQSEDGAIPSTKPCSGWTRKILNHTSKVIRRQLDKNSTKLENQNKINPALLQDVFLRCIFDDLLKNYIVVVVLKFFPLLSVKNMHDHITFNKKYKNWNPEDWK